MEKKPPTISEIIGVLPALSEADRTLLKAALDGLTVTTDERNATTGLYEALCVAIGSSVPYGRFCQTPASKQWKLKSATAINFIETTFGSPNRIVTHNLMRMLSEALVDDLKAKGVPISIRSVVLSLDRLPQVFDGLFPDYRKNGWAHLVGQAMGRKP